jgi:hypothetical protein
MTETLEPVTKRKAERPAEQVAAEELVRRARGAGFVPDRAGRSAKQSTKVVIETALDQELTEHLGHERTPLCVAPLVRHAAHPSAFGRFSGARVIRVRS